jgi:molecular chaperone GrpE
MSERQEGAATAAPGSPDPQQAAAAYAAAEAAAPAREAAEPEDGSEAPLAEAQDHVDGSEPAEPEHPLERDLEELSARAEKADEYLELAQRTKADFENYRRRAEKKVGEAQDRGVAKLAKELFIAIDNLDRAVQASETFAAGSPEEPAAEVESQLASGIKLVHADVLAALARVGIEPYSPVGERFAPSYHEAVAHQPVEGADSGTVIEVYQQGFRLGETVLRPARVLVAA